MNEFSLLVGLDFFPADGKYLGAVCLQDMVLLLMDTRSTSIVLPATTTTDLFKNQSYLIFQIKWMVFESILFHVNVFMTMLCSSFGYIYRNIFISSFFVCTVVQRVYLYLYVM